MLIIYLSDNKYHFQEIYQCDELSSENYLKTNGNLPNPEHKSNEKAKVSGAITILLL